MVKAAVAHRTSVETAPATPRARWARVRCLVMICSMLSMEMAGLRVGSSIPAESSATISAMRPSGPAIVAAHGPQRREQAHQLRLAADAGLGEDAAQMGLDRIR